MIQNNPQLQQMVEQVRENPEILQVYMEQMAEQNPDLLRVSCNFSNVASTNFL